MQIDVTRYEQTGHVFDFGVQNLIVTVFVSLCWAALAGAFFLYATAPLAGEVPRAASRRRLLAPPAVVAGVVVAICAFFGTEVYRSSLFPTPRPTNEVIMAQSARTAALTALVEAYPGPVGFDSDSAMATESASLRSATPRTYSVSFHMTGAGKARSCAGTVVIAGPVPAVKVTAASHDQLNPGTGRPNATYAPVIVTAQCSQDH